MSRIFLKSPANRYLHLSTGELIQVGETTEYIDTPHSDFVLEIIKNNGTLEWSAITEIADSNEKIRYTLILDGTSINCRYNTSYNINYLSIGYHTAKLIGTCQHGITVETVELPFIIEESHHNITLDIYKNGNLLEWNALPNMYADTENLSYSLSIDNTIVYTGTNTSYNISNLSNAVHNIILTGTCKHGNISTASTTLDLSNAHHNFSILLSKEQDTLLWNISPSTYSSIENPHYDVIINNITMLSNTTLTSYDISSLAVGTYSVYIRATCSHNNTYNSNQIDFTIEEPHHTFALNLDISNKMLFWEMSPTTYVATESPTYQLVINNNTPINCGTNTTYDLSNLEPGDYTLTVNATCAHGNIITKSTTYTVINTQTSFDSYRLRISWQSDRNNICVMGIYVNGSSVGTNVVTGGRMNDNGRSQTLSSENLSNACSTNGQGYQCYCDWVEYDINTTNIQSIGFHTNQWYQPDGVATMTVYGVSNGNVTEIKSNDIRLNTNTQYNLELD